VPIGFSDFEMKSVTYGISNVAMDLRIFCR